MKKLMITVVMGMIAATAVTAAVACEPGATSCGADGWVYRCILNTFTGQTWWLGTFIQCR